VNKISLIATTVITGAVLFTTANVSEAKADEVTANNAKDVAQQAMKNSGGNPNLQNFNAVKDKGDYYEIGINNKSGAGVGTYKVYKDGEVQYKSGNFGNYSTLNSEDCYTGQDITTKPYKEPKHVAKKEVAVDSTRELNSFYVGDVKSSDLPKHSKSSLPETGHNDTHVGMDLIAGTSLLAGGLLIGGRKRREKTS